MSSLRNAVKRVTHKERSQPRARSHLGLLEKKSDYKQRSRDYHSKQSRLKSMRTKAANRNPDEFYFGMHSSKVDGLGFTDGGGGGNDTGRHVKTQEARRREMDEKGLGNDAVRIMKDQDLAYVRMRRMMDGRKIEKLQSSLHYLESGRGGGHGEEGDNEKLLLSRKRKHTIFVEGGAGQKQLTAGGDSEDSKFDLAKHFGTVPELVGRAFNRPRIADLERQAAAVRKVKVPIRDGDDEYYRDDDDDDDDEDECGLPPQLTERQLLKLQRRRRKVERSVAKSRSAAYAEMELRNERMKKLEAAEARLVVEKQANMKGRKRKVVVDGDAGAEGGGRPAVYKWRRKRAK